MALDTSFSFDGRMVDNQIEDEDMWSSMLSSVASSKRLPAKTILVLGGGIEEQRDFVEALGSSNSRKTDKKPPLANEFALGYTYLDILDSDHEDVATRLGIYMLSNPTPSFAPLLRPLFTPQALQDTILVMLLDWHDPWDWLRQIRRWIRLLRDTFFDLDDDAKLSLEEVMKAWETRPRNFAEIGNVQQAGIADVQIPLGPGEFDEPIGLPLCVVCQNADQIELLERERGWKEEDFDFVLQFLRTVLLKHGASLIYTSTTQPSSLEPLIHATLGVPSPSKVHAASSHVIKITDIQKQTLRHNVIERDKVLVPPSWDSWGKIRVLRDFEVETVGTGWSSDIQTSETPFELEGDVPGGAVELYEGVIQNTRKVNSATVARPKNALEMQPVDTQEYLAAQMEILEARKDEEKAAISSLGGKNAMGMTQLVDGDSRVRDHVGPVQFNVGGIHVDADDMLRRLKDRESTPVMDSPLAGSNPTSSSATPNLASSGGAVDGKSQNEVLAQFFSSLMKKGPKTGGTGTSAKSTGSGSGVGN